MARLFVLIAAMLALVAMQASAAVTNPQHNVAYYRRGNSTLAEERMKRGQYNPRLKRPSRTRRAAAAVSPAICPLTPTGSGTGTCHGTGTEACTDPYYTVSVTGITLTSGTFQSGDYINFAYINCKDYTGKGSYANQNGVSWNVMQGSLHVEGNNQPGTPYIGKNYIPYSAGASMPANGYCIVWTQVNNFNAHFGSGGQAPICTSRCCPVGTTLTTR